MVEEARKLLVDLKLDQASDASTIIARVADGYFEKAETVADYVRIAHIAASLGASVPTSFRYFTRDQKAALTSYGVLADLDSDLDLMLDEDWCEEHVLDAAYGRESSTCSMPAWEQWAASPRSQLLLFPALLTKELWVWSRSEVETFLRQRGGSNYFYPYKHNSFIVRDWDFSETHWRHWQTLAEDDPRFWGRLMSRIMAFPNRHLSSGMTVSILQEATTGSTQRITSDQLLPAWIMKFRTLPCLPDTKGHYCEPSELLRRTASTEALLDVEPFVSAEVDTEQNRALLVKLGVRDTPTGPDRLLDRLRAWAGQESAPVFEVAKWYSRLDQLVSKGGTEDVDMVRSAFTAERIVLTASDGWVTAKDAFLHSDDAEVPDLPTVHPMVRDLALWHRVGMADHPTADQILAWLRCIPSGSRPSPDELRRIRSLLPRYAERAWCECGHWLNLEGEWIAVDELAYRLTMQSLTPWSTLFTGVKRRTADFTRLSAELCQTRPFSTLKDLAQCIEERLGVRLEGISAPTEKEWLSALGCALERVVLDNEAETDVRLLGHQLSQTLWQPTSALESVPYIDGTPAGTARKIEALWSDGKLHVVDRSTAKLCKPVCQELGRFFDSLDVKEAIRVCYERDGGFILDYMSDAFQLLPERVEAPVETEEQADEAGNVVEPEVGNGTLAAPTYADEGSGSSTPGAAPQGDQTSPGVGPQTTITRTYTPHPRKPSLFERYAQEGGYEKDEETGRYRHPDGSTLLKATDSPFQGEKYTDEGELVRSLWFRENCLWTETISIPAPVWDLCELHPGQYGLVLIDVAGKPVEMTGDQLIELRESGQLTVFPAEYRIDCTTAQERHR